MTAKRKRQEVDDGTEDQNSPTVQQARHGTDQDRDAEVNSSGHELVTPSKRRRGRPLGSKNKTKTTPNGIGHQPDQHSLILKSNGKLLFATPSKKRVNLSEKDFKDTIPIVSNADRSARRKSARALFQRTVNDDQSDEDPNEDQTLEKSIWDVEDEEESDGQRGNYLDDGLVEDPIATPSKRHTKQRPKTRQKRSSTPPQDLPPHELYFFQNRTGNLKTSNNTLSSLSLLSHEQYHQQINTYQDPHASSLTFLHSLHSRSFPQWNFELSQSFSICLYGYGSKRRLITSFASHLHYLQHISTPKIIIINGYTPTISIRQILTTIATIAYDCPASSLPPKLGSQPREIITSILNHLTASTPSSPIHLFINSLDAPPLRRAPTPSLLALLAASPHIRLLASCDTPTFPLLWDATAREQYNFLFHDATTYESYAPVEIGRVIDDVNDLLGRSGRSIKGKEGVGFVLRSLPENARNLYRVLVAELLASMDENEPINDNDNDNDAGQEEFRDAERRDNHLGSSHKGKRADLGVGVEYRVLYQKVVEEFICTSEMAFRTLLKEFHDHQMVESRRDGAGTEMLGVPFRRAEMEAILEDLVVG